MLVGDSAPAAQRGRAVAMSATANFLGQFLSPLVLGPLAEATSITGGFIILAAASGIFSILVLRFGTAVRPPARSAAKTRLKLPDSDPAPRLRSSQRFSPPISIARRPRRRASIWSVIIFFETAASVIVKDA